MGFSNGPSHARPLPGSGWGRSRAWAYSQDLRDRVIDAGLSGGSARQAAARFGVGEATAIVWVRRARNRQTFAVLGVSGAVLFYLGKQIPYFIAFPPYRVSNVVNTLICVGITVIATFLPRPEYSLIMMCFGMFVYVQLNLRWTIPLHNVDAYLVAEETA